jgi:hypothetical protein
VAQLVAALGGVAEAFSAGAGGAGAAVDLAPVVDALGSVAKAVAVLADAGGTTNELLAALRDCLCKLAENAGAIDAGGLVEQLKRIADAVETDPVELARFKQLVEYWTERGVIDPQVAQVLLA